MQYDYSETIMQDVTSKPSCLKLDNGKIVYLKVDAIVIENGVCALGGWQSEPFVIGIESEGEFLSILQHNYFMREDVNLYLGTDSSQKHGFGIAFNICDNKNYNIIAGNEVFHIDIQKACLGFKGYENVLGDTLVKFLRSKWDCTQIWKDNVERGTSHLKCGLDYALRWPDEKLGNPIVVTGWFAIPDDIRIYVGHGLDYYTPKMYLFNRADIIKDYDISFSNKSIINGFIFIIKNYSANACKLGIYAEKNGIKAKIAEIKITDYYSYRSFLRAIFDIDFSQNEMSTIYQHSLIPFLTEIQEKRIKIIMGNDHIIGKIGENISTPVISVIIPLYGTLDYLEKQIQYFSWDNTFHKKSELIYVISDPELLDKFLQAIYDLTKLYGISCRWIYAHISLGYAEACNLGANMAKSDHIVFMNSDVYPVRPGWLQAFLEFFAIHPDAGIVGCHLIYPNGKSQYCGADLFYNPLLKIWDCVSLQDNHGTAPRQISYLIGACFAMRKLDFCDVNGFSTEYLIGNSEDLDLCEKIRKSGKQIWYLPIISMVHENHQSFKSMEGGKWQDRLFLYNATVFSSKWKKGIAQNDCL